MTEFPTPQDSETRPLQEAPAFQPYRPTAFGRLCRTLVFRALSAMGKGRLTLHLPEGGLQTFGEPDLGQEIAHQAIITLHSDQFFTRMVLFGHIGAGESYVDGDWDTPDIAAVIAWFILNMEDSTVLDGSPRKARSINLLGEFNRLMHRLRENNPSMSRKNIRDHYDLSNDFFRLFLDDSMTYSSARFEYPGQTLEEAQTAKYDNLCRNLRLSAKDRVLEIGTGWGGFASHAARNYGCQVVTLTISEEQCRFAKRRLQAEGLADRVTVELRDYRTLDPRNDGRFDKIVSIEMIEAVGDAFLDTFMGKCAEMLHRHGLLGLQMITCPDSRYELLKGNVDFIQRHIFPGSLLPSIGRINEATSRTSALFLHELEDLGPSYVKTLSAWHERFNASLPKIRALGFDERFIRKWRYYLLYCKAAFAMRNITVVQALYTGPNNLLLSKEAGPC